MYNIIIFGDSIVQGKIDDEQGGWAARLALNAFNRMTKVGSLQLTFPLGISAETSSGLVTRFGPEIQARTKRQPAALVIAIGMNDSRVSRDTNTPQVTLEAYVLNLHKIYAIAKEKNFPLIFVGLTAVDESRTDPVAWDANGAYRNSQIHKYNDALMQVCKETRSHYVPVLDLFESRPEMLIDGLHPNAEGHRLMFERVKEYLEKAGII